MRAHRAEVHGADLDLKRDVSFVDNVSETAPLTYIAPTEASRALFHCSECGMRLGLGDPYAGSPGRRAFLRTFDPNLRAALALTDPADHDALVDLAEHRKLGSALVDRAQRSEALKTAHEKPETRQRIANCQRFMLERRAAGRTVEEAVEDLMELERSDPARYRQLTIDGKPRAANTFLDYYKKLSRREKDAGRQAFLRARGETR